MHIHSIAQYGMWSASGVTAYLNWTRKHFFQCFNVLCKSLNPLFSVISCWVCRIFGRSVKTLGYFPLYRSIEVAEKSSPQKNEEDWWMEGRIISLNFFCMRWRHRFSNVWKSLFRQAKESLRKLWREKIRFETLRIINRTFSLIFLSPTFLFRAFSFSAFPSNFQVPKRERGNEERLFCSKFGSRYRFLLLLRVFFFF